MKKTVIFIILAICLNSKAELKLFLDFTVDSKASLQQLDEALKIGSELKAALKKLKENDIQNEDYSKLKRELNKYEAEMLKVYGIYPGLTYRMVSTSGYIYQLLPVSKRDEYLEKGYKIPLSSPVTIIKNKDGQAIECLKVKIKLLQKRDSVMHFNRALMTAGSLRAQIQNLEKQLDNKPEISKRQEIKKGMADLKEALKAIELKMNERFGVRNEGKYIFEPKTGAVYLALDQEDLSKLSDLKKARNK